MLYCVNCLNLASHSPCVQEQWFSTFGWWPRGELSFYRVCLRPPENIDISISIHTSSKLRLGCNNENDYLWASPSPEVCVKALGRLRTTVLESLGRPDPGWRIWEQSRSGDSQAGKFVGRKENEKHLSVLSLTRAWPRLWSRLSALTAVDRILRCWGCS